MTADISRHSLRPLQKFTGVVRQQGRLPLDAEETEADDIGALMLREAVAETICEKGAPGDGFRVTDAGIDADDRLDFSLDGGSFYLAGLRLSTAIVPGSGATHMTYQNQPDWIGMDLDVPGPPLPGPGEERTDLVYLMGWEQTVTATEDAELFEVALGGADSAARRRVMGRVKVLDDVPDTCAAAFADLVAREFPGGTLDPAGCEVVSDTRLTIGFTQLDPLNDLCRPSAQAGFLGARNETFRIQVTSPGRFVWGRDNAAPLYRVQVQQDQNGNRRRIHFLTPPRDEFGWPLAGMTVELMRWGAVMDNMEKVAEPTGLLLRVETGYDPEHDRIHVGADIPQAWDDWFNSADGQAAINPLDDASAGLERYFFLRVWTGGGEGTAVDHAIDLIDPVELGETGLTAQFSANGMPGDHWIVSARPNTPTRVTPLKLLTGAPPAGPRRLLAPLALIPWTGPVPGDPLDCRHRFRPLCRVGGCCRVTVGDGVVSHGDVTSIQEAVDRLPPEGGEVCIHEGEYAESVVIENGQNITITGCGRGTLWSRDPARNEALITLVDCQGTHIRRITMEAAGVEAVVAKASGPGSHGGLLLEDLAIGIDDRSAVLALDLDRATVRRCGITLRQMSEALSQSATVGRTAAIFMGGSDLTVEDCRIDGTEITDRLFMATGGIHIAGPSERIIIRDNVITGGNGHGITLGAVQFVADDGDIILGPGPAGGDFTVSERFDSVARQPGYYIDHKRGGLGWYGFGTFVDKAGCIRLPGTPEPEDLPEDVPLTPESGGLVRDIRILRNDITLMGFSGISAHLFSGLGKGGFSDLVGVESAEIAENRITGCMINEVGPTTPLLRQFIGWGGIALSLCSDATIRDNLIAGNGTAGPDPICGVFFAIAEDVRIERNRIEGNGITPGENVALAPGRRGGIVIGLTMGGVSTYAPFTDDRRSADTPALLVSGNTVDAPGARALKAIAMGPVMVLGNRLTGAGASALMSNLFGSLVGLGFALSRLSGQITDPNAPIDFIDYVALEILSDVLGGDAVNLVNLCVAEEAATIGGLDEGYVPDRLRGGEMLIDGNQIALRAHSDTFQITLSSVFLLSADDIGFTDNQCEVENAVLFTLSDLIAFGATLRVSTNRVQKRLTGGIISAITFAFMNQTALNQTTHCIIALGLSTGREVVHNRNMFGLFGSKFCSRWGDYSTGYNATYDTRHGVQSELGG